MTKPAFMIFGVDIHDADKFGEYAAGAGAMLGEHGVSVMSATNKIELLDGAWDRKRVTVLKFPSLEVAHTFWNSAEYAPWKTLRESCSSADIVLVEGLIDEDPASAPTTATEVENAHYVLGRSDNKNTDWTPEYMEKVPPVADKWEVVALCSGPEFEVLDGTLGRESIVLLQFKSEAAYRGFWWDDNYMPMKTLREENTLGDHIAFPGGFDPL